MSQTPWVLDDGERRTETALTEYIENVIKHYFKADEYRFATSGREDVDVRYGGWKALSIANLLQNAGPRTSIQRWNYKCPKTHIHAWRIHWNAR